MIHSRPLLALAPLLLLGSIVTAQSRPEATEEGSTELAIAVKQDVVKVGDVITLQITLKNMHKDKYCRYVNGEDGKAELNGYALEVTDLEGNIHSLLKQKRLRGGSLFGQCIDHGKTASETMNINRLVDLGKPGTYYMRVSHVDKITNQVVWSNRLTITVVQ